MESNLMFSENELDQDISFEVTKNVKVTARVNYKKGDVIEGLINRIKHLESQIKNLEGKNICPQGALLLQGTLEEIWGDEKENVWDKL